MADQHEEQDQADHGADEQQEAGEESLGRSHAVHTSRLLSMSHGDGTTREHNFEATLQVLLAGDPERKGSGLEIYPKF